MSKTALVFAGQGAQVVGMGKDLAATFPTAKNWFDRANAALGYDLAAICFNGPEADLTKTENAQPGIFLVSWVCFELLKEKVPTLKFDATAGLSLGEFTALTAAGAMTFEDGLRVVRQRGKFMQEACDVTKGGMAAVIGLAPDRIQAVLHASAEGSRLDVANFNSFDQTVIAGPKDAITAVKPEFEAAGVRAFIPLKVSAPFHSRYMQGPQDEFADFLASFSFGAPAVPVLNKQTPAFIRSSVGGFDRVTPALNAITRGQRNCVTRSLHLD